MLGRRDPAQGDRGRLRHVNFARSRSHGATANVSTGSGRRTRHGRHEPTPTRERHEWIGDPTLADAILDPLVQQRVQDRPEKDLLADRPTAELTIYRRLTSLRSEERSASVHMPAIGVSTSRGMRMEALGRVGEAATRVVVEYVAQRAQRPVVHVRDPLLALRRSLTASHATGAQCFVRRSRGYAVERLLRGGRGGHRTHDIRRVKAALCH